MKNEGMRSPIIVIPCAFAFEIRFHRQGLGTLRATRSVCYRRWQMLEIRDVLIEAPDARGRVWAKIWNACVSVDEGVHSTCSCKLRNKSSQELLGKCTRMACRFAGCFREWESATRESLLECHMVLLLPETNLEHGLRT